MTTVTQPRIDYRDAQTYMGIRVQVSMRGMSKVIASLSKEITNLAKHHGVVPAGPPFLRYHVIDMAGEMDIEIGIPVSQVVPGTGKISAGVLPAGKYASLVYTGSGLSGNKALIDWAKANNIAWDRWEDEKGDAFRSRYETFLTDPKTEPRKTRWKIEVAIKIAEQ